MISTFSVSITIVGSMFSVSEEPIDDAARRRPGLEQHERLARQILRRRSVCRRASGCVGVVTSSSSSRSTGTVTRSDSSTGSVSRPASTRPARISSTDRPAGRHRQPHVELRMHAPQVLQQRREHVEADGHAARQAQRAAQLARAIGDRADGFAHVLKDALAELHEALGRRRHPHLAADAQKQRLAELLFEQQNLPADGRLRDVQLPAARRERSGFGDGLEDFELAEIHADAG